MLQRHIKGVVRSRTDVHLDLGSGIGRPLSGLPLEALVEPLPKQSPGVYVRTSRSTAGDGQAEVCTVPSGWAETIQRVAET